MSISRVGKRASFEEGDKDERQAGREGGWEGHGDEGAEALVLDGLGERGGFMKDAVGLRGATKGPGVAAGVGIRALIGRGPRIAVFEAVVGVGTAQDDGEAIAGLDLDVGR